MYGDKIKQLRKKRGINQAELSKKTGVPQSTLSIYEKQTHLDTQFIEKALKVLAPNLETWEFFITEEQREKLTGVPAPVIKIYNELKELPIEKQKEFLGVVRDLLIMLRNRDQNNSTRG